MHIIKLVCRERGITYSDFAAAVRKKNRRKSPGAPFIAQIVCGHKRPSPEMAEAISKTFPEISRAELIWPDKVKKVSGE
jgi:hypothetical protein